MTNFRSLNGYEVEDPKARIYPNVAAMKTISNLTNGDIIKTAGYYTAGDGGSATYLIRAKTETDVEDLGSIHFINDELVAELLVENEVNVKQFGVVGDGEHDDTVKLQNFFNCKSNEYIIENGTYLVSNDINLKNSNCIIVGKGNPVIIRQTNNLEKYYIINCYNLHDVTISNIIIVGDKTTHTGIDGEWGHCLNITDCYNILVKDSIFKDGWGDGVYIGYEYTKTPINRVNNIVLKNCKTLNNSRNGISITSGDNITIDGCYLYKTDRVFPKSGIDVELEHSEISNVHLNNLTIKDCVTEQNFNFGINISLNYESNNIIVKNLNSINDESGILIRSRNKGLISVSDCIFNNLNNVAIQIEDNVENSYININNITVIGSNHNQSDTGLYASSVLINAVNRDIYNIDLNNLHVKKGNDGNIVANSVYGNNSTYTINNCRFRNIDDKARFLFTNVPENVGNNAKLSNELMTDTHVNMGGANPVYNELTYITLQSDEITRLFNMIDGEYKINVLNRNDKLFKIGLNTYTSLVFNGIETTNQYFNLSSTNGSVLVKIVNRVVYVTSITGNWENVAS